MEARVSDRSQSQFDAKPAKLDEEKSVATVTNGCYLAELPADMGLYGDAAVAAGGNYTFQTDPHYDYTFTATVGDDPATVIDNNGGSYTVQKRHRPAENHQREAHAQDLFRHGSGQRQR